MCIRFPRRPTIWTAVSLMGMSLAGASGLRGDSVPSPALPTATQAWRTLTDKQLLCVASDQIWIPGPGPVKILGIERRERKAWMIRDEDYLKTWKVSQQAETLRTEISGKVTEYRRLDSVPVDCRFNSVPIGQPHAVSWERADAVSREIHERMVRDQVSMKAGNLAPTSEVIVENREYLKALIQELGWIDLHRFGHEGSGNAIILAQHSQELPLMTAILPFVEKDYKHDAEGSVMFAILYDRLLINLGHKQRYGTQTGRDSEGNPMVLPLEDAARVEQLRKEIGLPPLAEYLQLASEGLYAGKPIRMPRADE